MKYFVYCRKSSEEEDRQVQSIDSQERELSRLFGAQPGIDVVDTLKEAQSAMTLGRPIFNGALDRIERGEADGLIAWAPDRLARNSVDGGRVIYLLDTGKLKDLKFATFTFENTPSGKFMLSILFGQSKYYSDALSENVRRGIRTKLEKGWLPHMAKVGYLNDRATATIVADPERFPLIREMWELMLTGAHSVQNVHRIMASRGLTTIARKNVGGKPLSVSGTYRLLTSPFYAGIIPWKGKVYPGKHRAVVTLDEFESVQRLLGRSTQPRSKTREFAFTGLMKCGECGLSITAEEKTNRFGSKYTYYHCTKRRLDRHCVQPSIEKGELERQFEAFLLRLRIHPDLDRWALDMAKRDEREAEVVAVVESKAINAAIARNDTARKNLTKLRIADRITESEFETERGEIDNERLRLEQRKSETTAATRFEPGALCLNFSIRAAEWFRSGNDATKRLIVEIAGSNPVLVDKKLKVDAAKLFRSWENVASIPTLRGSVNDVRTLQADEDVVLTLTRLTQLVRRLAETAERAGT